MTEMDGGFCPKLNPLTIRDMRLDEEEEEEEINFIIYKLNLKN